MSINQPPKREVFYKAETQSRSAGFSFMEMVVSNSGALSLVWFFFWLIVFLFPSFWVAKIYYFDQSALLENIKNEFEDQQNRLSRYSSVDDIVKNYGDLDQAVRLMLPSQKDLSELYLLVEKIAIKNSLFLRNLNLAEVPNKNKEKSSHKIEKISVTMSLSGGDYFLLKNFLRDLENSSRFFQVVSLAYSPKEKQYNLKMELFYLPD